jgi:ribosomal protein L7Ae-like RNA K-turn-binding protein
MGAFKDSLKKAKENTNKPISNPISDVEKSYNQRLNDADKLSNEIKREFENDCKETKYREYTIVKSKNELSKSHGKEVSLQLNKGSKKCIKIRIIVYYSKVEFEIYKEKERISSTTNISECDFLIKQIINDMICPNSNEGNV